MKVSRVFWVSDCELGCLKDGFRLDITLLKNEDKIYKNKITISYEIDREVTIKESELEGVLNKHLSSGLTVDTIMNELFGGGEND